MAFVAGFLLTLSISLLWSARGVLRDRRLIRDAIAGQPPVDGKWAGFSGVIRASSPITSPISGKSAVAFKYTISQSVGSGKSSHLVSHYEGTALAAPKISTSAGTYRLLAVPTFDMETSDVEKATPSGTPPPTSPPRASRRHRLRKKNGRPWKRNGPTTMASSGATGRARTKPISPSAGSTSR